MTSSTFIFTTVKRSGDQENQFTFLRLKIRELIKKKKADRLIVSVVYMKCNASRPSPYISTAATNLLLRLSIRNFSIRTAGV